MKKADLKKLIKPLVKECIHEVLIEEGVLSNVVSEVAKGMQSNVVVENTNKKQDKHLFNEDLQMKRSQKEGRLKLQEHRKKLLEAVSTDAYNGVDLFEGTEPMSSYEATEQKGGSVDLGNPRDSGVDISSLLGGASQVWEQMKRK